MTVKQATVAQESLQWGLLPPEWSDLIKEDWQNKTNGINEVAEVANEANVTANNEVEKNEAQDKAIENNRQTINTLAENILINDQKTSNNTKSIAENKQGIADNKKVIDEHVADKSAHGATGDIVGNENFAGETVGGVVLIAGKLTELEKLIIEVPPAPGEYSQEYMQTVANSINSLVSKQGDIITLLNQVISTQVAAKQRAQNADVSSN